MSDHGVLQVPRKIGDITLQEFLGMGPQKGFDKVLEFSEQVSKDCCRS
jgi:hypothetical protein